MPPDVMFAHGRIDENVSITLQQDSKLLTNRTEHAGVQRHAKYTSCRFCMHICMLYVWV